MMDRIDRSSLKDLFLLFDLNEFLLSVSIRSPTSSLLSYSYPFHPNFILKKNGSF